MDKGSADTGPFDSQGIGRDRVEDDFFIVGGNIFDYRLDGFQQQRMLLLDLDDRLCCPKLFYIISRRGKDRRRSTGGGKVFLDNRTLSVPLGASFFLRIRKMLIVPLFGQRIKFGRGMGAGCDATDKKE